MSETGPSPRPRAPRPIDTLRERLGGASTALQQMVKEQARVRRAIRTGLEAGPRTVPALAAESQLDPGVVLWQLMAMRRYGQVVEAGIEGRYPTYALKEEQ